MVLHAGRLIMCALLMYMRTEKNQARKSYLGFGCALGAAFLMKYDFGLALISAFAVVATTVLLVNRGKSYLRNVIQVARAAGCCLPFLVYRAGIPPQQVF